MTLPIVCGRCGQEVQAIIGQGQRVQWPKGWFELEPGDWRCGCILKVRPDCDAANAPRSDS